MNRMPPETKIYKHAWRVVLVSLVAGLGYLIGYEQIVKPETLTYAMLVLFFIYLVIWAYEIGKTIEKYNE